MSALGHVLLPLVLVAAWLVLLWVVLPRLGVPT
jgi:hypothetical protein